MPARSHTTGQQAIPIHQLLNAPKVTKPKRKTNVDALVESVTYLADAISAQNKATKKTIEGDSTEEEPSGPEYTDRNIKWLSNALNLFNKDGWEDKVDEEVALYAFQQWETSPRSALYFLTGSDRRREAYFKMLKKKVDKEGLFELNSGVCSSR